MRYFCINHLHRYERDPWGQSTPTTYHSIGPGQGQMNKRGCIYNRPHGSVATLSSYHYVYHSSILLQRRVQNLRNFPY